MDTPKVRSLLVGTNPLECLTLQLGPRPKLGAYFFSAFARFCQIDSQGNDLKKSFSRIWSSLSLSLSRSFSLPLSLSLSGIYWTREFYCRSSEKNRLTPARKIIWRRDKEEIGYWDLHLLPMVHTSIQPVKVQTIWAHRS